MDYGVCGHNERIASILHALEHNLGSRAYLFYGDAQTGKALSASVITHILEGRDHTTRSILADTLNLFSDGASLGVDIVSSIRSFLRLRPQRSRFRAVVIDGAECFTREAQSALLKVVEEPPDYAVFFFITSSPHVLAIPLVSRLFKIYFPRLPQAVIQDYLVERYQVPPSRSAQIARASFGSFGRALNLLSNKGHCVGPESDFEVRVLQDILNLYFEGARQNAARISKLLRVLVSASSVNINPVLYKGLFR